MKHPAIGPTPFVSEVPASAAETLAPILAAAEIESASTVRYAGHASATVPTPDPEHKALTAALTGFIYNFGYAHSKIPDAATEPRADADFHAALSSANRSRERWDPLWRVYQADSSLKLSVEKRGVHRQAAPGHYTFTSAPNRSAAGGDEVTVHAPKESANVQPGFYFAFGETLASEFDDAQLSRFYFNLAVSSVPELLAWISTDLNRYRIPYRFKCLLDPALYERRDPAVLYLGKRFVPAFLRLAAARRKILRDQVRDGVPMFTKPLLRGVGAADEPGGGLSFGQSRSRMVAEGLVAAWLRGEERAAERLQSIAARFVASGISMGTPWLSESARDLYHWPEEN